MRNSVYCTFRLTIAALVLLLLASCATKRDVLDLRKDLEIKYENTEFRLDSIGQSLTGLEELVREQSRLTHGLKAMLGSQSQEDRDNIELIAARQDEINYQLRDLLEKLQAIQLYGGMPSAAPSQSPASQTVAKKTSAPAPTPSPSKSASQQATSSASKVDPQELYNAALEDINNERYQLGESRFLSFLMQFPKDKLAGNAQYWLGEAVYGQEKYELAIKEFENVLKKFKKSPKVPAASLKIGFAQFKLGQNKQAVQTLNKLIKSHPDSDEAELARQRLNAPEEQ